jgi:flagellar hook-length control protein FliK
VFSVTSDVAASASYSSAPAKPVGRDPSQAGDSFAALVDSNIQPDPPSAPSQSPEPPPSQRPSRDNAPDRSPRDTSAVNDPAPQRDAPPTRSGRTGDNNATSSDGKTDASRPSGGKSASKTDDGKSTDKISGDKASSDDASATDAGTAAQQNATPLTGLNVVATVIPGPADPAIAPAASGSADTSNGSLAIAAAVSAGVSPTAAAAVATAAQAQPGFGLPGTPANATDKMATGKPAGETAATDASTKQTAASAVPGAAADDTALSAAVAAPGAKGTTGLKTQAATSTKTAALSEAANGASDAPAPQANTAADPGHGKAAPQPTGTGQEDAGNIVGDSAKSPGASLSSGANPSNHERSSVLAATPAAPVSADASAQAAALPPQTSLAPTAPTAALSVTPTTGAPVPVSGLAIEIAASVQGGKSRFEVRLDPAELGRIDVRIDVDRNGQVTSHLTVEKPETLSMLRQDAPQLQQALNDAGLKTGNGGLQFSLRDQSSGQNNSNDNQSGAPAQRLIVNDEETVPSLVVGRSYGRTLGSSGGIDIRV